MCACARAHECRSFCFGLQEAVEVGATTSVGIVAERAVTVEEEHDLPLLVLTYTNLALMAIFLGHGALNVLMVAVSAAGGLCGVGDADWDDLDDREASMLSRKLSTAGRRLRKSLRPKDHALAKDVTSLKLARGRTQPHGRRRFGGPAHAMYAGWQRRVVMRVLLRWRQAELRRPFAGWLWAVDRRKRLRGVCAACAARIGHAGMARAVSLWISRTRVTEREALRLELSRLRALDACMASSSPDAVSPFAAVPWLLPAACVRASVSAERRTAAGGLGEIAAIEAELRRLDSKISAAVQGGWMQPGEARDSRIDVLSAPAEENEVLDACFVQTSVQEQREIELFCDNVEGLTLHHPCMMPD